MNRQLPSLPPVSTPSTLSHGCILLVLFHLPLTALHKSKVAKGLLVGRDGPLALLEHGVGGLLDLWASLCDVVDGELLEWTGVLDVGEGLCEGFLLGRDLGDGLLCGGDLGLVGEGKEKGG